MQLHGFDMRLTDYNEQKNPRHYKGSGTSTTVEQAEIKAIKSVLNTYDEDNDYPIGHIDIAVVLQEGKNKGKVLRDTYSTYTKMKKAGNMLDSAAATVGKIAMVVGVAAMFIPGLQAFVLPLIMYTSAALTVASVGMSMAERIKAGTFWEGKALVGDLINLAGAFLSVWGLRIANASKAVKGMYFIAEGVEFAAGGIMIGVGAKVQIDGVRAQYARRLAHAKNEAERQKIMKERNLVVAQIMSDAVSAGMMYGVQQATMRVLPTMQRAGVFGRIGRFKVDKSIVDAMGRQDLDALRAIRKDPKTTRREKWIINEALLGAKFFGKQGLSANFLEPRLERRAAVVEGGAGVKNYTNLDTAGMSATDITVAFVADARIRKGHPDLFDAAKHPDFAVHYEAWLKHTVTRGKFPPPKNVPRKYRKLFNGALTKKVLGAFQGVAKDLEADVKTARATKKSAEPPVKKGAPKTDDAPKTDKPGELPPPPDLPKHPELLAGKGNYPEYQARMAAWASRVRAAGKNPTKVLMDSGRAPAPPKKRRRGGRRRHERKVAAWKKAMDRMGLDGEVLYWKANHPGVELHNHFLGVREAEYFRKAVGGDGPDAAVKLFKRIAKAYEHPDMKAESPTGLKKVQETQRKLAMEKDPVKRAAIAEKANKEILVTQDGHPFDATYGPRGELIKDMGEQLFHKGAAKSIGELMGGDLAAGKMPTNEQLAAKLGKASQADFDAFLNANPTLRQRLEAQHKAKIEARKGPDKRLKPEDLDTGKPEGLAAMAKNLRHHKEQLGYRKFIYDTLKALHKDGITYSEQSFSVSKMLRAVPEADLKFIIAKLKSEGIQIEVKWLPLITTMHVSSEFMVHQDKGGKAILNTEFMKSKDNPQGLTGTQAEGLISHFMKTSKTRAEAIKKVGEATSATLLKVKGTDGKPLINKGQADMLTKQLPPATRKKLEAMLERGDVIGFDIAAPEKHVFTQRGLRNFQELYKLLSAAAKKRGKPVVLRPHVGEGYTPTRSGKIEMGADGKTPKHYETAQKNMTLLLGQLQAMGYNAGKGKADGVVVRFGHATHATQKHAKMMADMGIIAEVNLGSNAETGAVLPPKRRVGPDGKMIVERTDVNPKNEPGAFNDHSLLHLLFAKVKVVLNTDAHGVMSADLPHEYGTAARIVQQFKDGNLTMQLDGKTVHYKDVQKRLGKAEAARRFSMNRVTAAAKGYKRDIKSQSVAGGK